MCCPSSALLDGHTLCAAVAFFRRLAGTDYTTNAIESINAQLRKIIKTRGHFPSDEAATKLLWLALRNITGKWGSSTHDWKAAMNQFAVLYEDRFTQPHR